MRKKMKGVFILTGFIVFVSPTHGEVICEDFGTHYTFCHDGYACCNNNINCCLNSVVVQNVTNEKSLGPGVIAAIVISSVVLVIVLGVLGLYFFTRFSKGKRIVNGEVIHVQPTTNTVTMEYDEPSPSVVPPPRYELPLYAQRSDSVRNTKFQGFETPDDPDLITPTEYDLYSPSSSNTMVSDTPDE